MNMIEILMIQKYVIKFQSFI